MGPRSGRPASCSLLTDSTEPDIENLLVRLVDKPEVVGRNKRTAVPDSGMKVPWCRNCATLVSAYSTALLCDPIALFCVALLPRAWLGRNSLGGYCGALQIPHLPRRRRRRKGEKGVGGGTVAVRHASPKTSSGKGIIAGCNSAPNPYRTTSKKIN